jgi:hypothetical protein
MLRRWRIAVTSGRGRVRVLSRRRALRDRDSSKEGVTVLLGMHESVAGGLEKAFLHAETHGDEAIQVFTKNASQW